MSNNIAPSNMPYPRTVGSIVTWAIVRAAIVIILSLVLYEYVKWIEYGVWWMVTFAALFAVVLYPAQIQYRLFKESTKNIVSGTLCSTCKYFEPTAIMCTMFDEHVSETYIPCEGVNWEPLSAEGKEE